MNDLPAIDSEPITKEPKNRKMSVWSRRFNNKKVKSKPNYVAVLLLKKSGRAETLEVESKKGMLNINGKTYHEDRDCVWRMGKDGVPLAIIDEESLLPLGTRRYYEARPDETLVDNIQRKCAEMQDHILRGIRHAEFVRLGERDGKKLNTKAVIIWLIVGIIGYAIFKGGGLA